MTVRVRRDYQGALLNFGREVPRCNWWAGTGTGKTGSGIELYDYLRMFSEVNRMLVVSTKRVSKQVWIKELRKWENFSHLNMAVAIGTADQRLQALRQTAQITTINYDNIPWLVDVYGEDHWPFDMVFADESSKVKNLRIDMRVSKLGNPFLRKSGGSDRAQRLAKIAHKKVRRWINATGTPASNGLVDLWGQSWYLDAGARLGRSYSAFEDRWFNKVRVPGDDWKTITTPKAHADAEIKALLRDVTITIDAKDYFDLPPTVVNRIMLTLPPKAYAHYREMEREMFTEINTHQIEAFNSGAKSMKCRQIAAGASIVDDKGNWTLVHDEKIDALHDIIADISGENLIVVYYFKSDLQRLMKAFPEGRHFDDSDATLNAFVAGKIPLLFVHSQSAAHGVDEMQQACRHICIFSPTWNAEDDEQVIARIGATRQVQAGFYRTVYVHRLIMENTVDEDMTDRLESKLSVMDSLKQAMKRRVFL